MEQNNTITHIEIPAPDLEAAIHFYSKIFNWNLEITEDGRYAYFKIGNTNTGGGFDSSLVPAPELQGPQVVIDVQNLEETMEKIKAAGGFITREKTPISGGHGFYAAFRDPNGNNLQIHSTR